MQDEHDPIALYPHPQVVLIAWSLWVYNVEPVTKLAVLEKLAGHKFEPDYAKEMIQRLEKGNLCAFDFPNRDALICAALDRYGTEAMDRFLLERDFHKQRSEEST